MYFLKSVAFYLTIRLAFCVRKIRNPHKMEEDGARSNVIVVIVAASFLYTILYTSENKIVCNMKTCVKRIAEITKEQMYFHKNYLTLVYQFVFRMGGGKFLIL